MPLFGKVGEFIREKITLFREYSKISESGEIARRYFAMNSFDGILTTLGILIGSWVGKVHEPKVVIMTGLGAAVAMGVSGFWGAYETEKAERARSLQEMERATLSSLEGTKIAEASKFATILVSFIDGISPFLAVLLVISPYLLGGAVGITEPKMYAASMAISFISLALLGAYLGKLSKANILKSSLKMVLIGIVCAIISVLLIGGAA